jgi:RimJ/RimL family protein N-acetyltransferase
MLHLRTERLQLVAVTLELARAERAGPMHLEKLLHAHVPPSWPPPLNDEKSLSWTIDFLTRNANGVGWGPWYFLHREHGALRLVGVGGFCGLPAPDGAVEIGYSIVPECHRLGLAPEAVRALVAWAFTHSEVERVIAHTLPALVPSIRVLEKCGFAPAGAGGEAGTVRYELVRPRGARR